VPLPDLPAVTRRVRRIARTNAPADLARVARVPAVRVPTPPPPRTVVAEAAERRSTPDEVAALLELTDLVADEPGDRAERARRGASLYLRERRRRLRRELGVLETEDRATS
jgi:hypothetical protein